MRWLVHTAVGSQFAEVVEVADGRELFWAMLRASFAAAPGRTPELVVIADVRMPEYDGLDVLDACHELGCEVPTIIMTAFSSPEVHDRAEALGAFVLPKPFSTATLHWLVRQMLDGLRNR